MSETVLLTVAIPTFNRANCLAVLLESICAQISPEHIARVEVVVFDNCSPDDTSEVVAGFVAACSCLKYVRNQTNIGADNNFVKAFTNARGKYLWILGDDELLFDGAVDWVLKRCAGAEFGAAYLYSVPEILENVHSFLGQKVPSLVSVKRFSPWGFVRAANYRLTFLSGSVINRQAVLETNPCIEQEIEQFSGSNLVHLTWILSAAKSRHQSLIVTTPLLASTVANSGGYSPVKVFVVNLSNLVAHYFSTENSRARIFMQRFALIGWFPKVIFDCRFSEKYRSTGYKFSADEFPEELRSGLIWALFDRGVLHGSKTSALLVMLGLKLIHKGLQALYLHRA